ncbi:MAG: hypothetical protein QG622_938 [Actinomycetota bacterium]|nr:hypothetical protein [Actinomycetota bacterium]
MTDVTDPTSMPSFTPGDRPADDNAMRVRVFDALLDEGFRPSVDSDGDVAFRAQGQQLFVRCLDTVPPLIRVFGQWIEQEVPGGEITRLRAANAVVGALNLIKATVVEDRLVVAVDLVLSDGLDLRPLLSATVEAVLHSVQRWYAAVVEYGAEADSEFAAEIEAARLAEADPGTWR